jgi:site-specific DNA recombinase
MNNYTGKRCVPYYRVSTDDQAERYSLTVQQELMETWAENQKVILDCHFVDDHSAKDFRRPGFTKLMSYVKKHRADIDLVLVIDWSRFSRNIKESYVKLHELEQFGVEVQAIEQLIDDNIPESTIIKAIYLATPDAENKRRSINVRKGMKQALKSGQWCGGKPPRGYVRDRNTMKLETTEEAVLIGEAYQRISSKGYSIKEALVYLQVRGMNVSFPTLSKMLRNPFYKGMIQHKLLGDQLAVGNHPPVVEAYIWQAVQDILENNVKGSSIEDMLPLKRFIKCGDCGRTMTGYQIKKKQKPNGDYRVRKSQPIYYKCQCANHSGAKMHEEFIDTLKNFCIDHTLVDSFRTVLTETYTRMSAKHEVDTKLLQRRITEQTTFRDKLDQKFVEGHIDTDTYKRQCIKNSQTLSNLNKELRSAQTISNPTLFVDFALKMATKIHILWSQSMIYEKRRLQHLVFPEGLSYSKANDQYLTPRINSLFVMISALNASKRKKAKPSLVENSAYSLTVVRNSDISNPSVVIEDFISINQHFEYLTL